MTIIRMLTRFSDDNGTAMKLGSWMFWLALFVASLGCRAALHLQRNATATITANVVVLDNPTIFNRLGAQNPNWMMYALKRDVVHKSSASSGRGGEACELPGGDADARL